MERKHELSANVSNATQSDEGKYCCELKYTVNLNTLTLSI
jgi:hypothetical protein